MKPTLRHLFAAASLAGLRAGSSDLADGDAELVAEQAFMDADAMLAESRRDPFRGPEPISACPAPHDEQG